MRIAYFTSMYPLVSLSFIRREILALEADGNPVLRIAIRPWQDKVVDPDDLKEQLKTDVLLNDGVIRLLCSALAVFASQPICAMRVLVKVICMAFGAHKGLIHHVAYYIEACALLRRLRRAKIEHVHVHFATNATKVAMICRMLGGPPYSFTVHGPFDFDTAMVQNFREKIHAAAFVVAISSFTRSQLFRWADHADWPKIHVVHCGVDAKFLSQPDPIQPASNTLLCVGRLTEQKGQLLLVEAMTELIRQGIQAQLVLAGDGEMRLEIERLIAKHHLGEHVRITGWVTSDQVVQLLRESRALVLPSFAEGLPVVIMEAFALGRPVISTFIAGIPELVRPGVNGWLTPASDIPALVDAMREVLEAPIDKLNEMGSDGHERVAREHDAAKEVIKLKALFQEFVASSKSN